MSEQHEPTDITEALRTLEVPVAEGAKIHAFRSGGGLRVVRLEKAGKLLGYGEHPYIEDALVHLAEDYLAGGRPYDTVYGTNGLHTGYWTGSSEASSPLDAWVLRGQTFDAYAVRTRFCVNLVGHGHLEHPAGVNERATAGETVIWEARGYTFETQPYMFPDGAAGCSTKPIKMPAGGSYAKAMSFTVKRTGMSDTLKNAFGLALLAKALEVRP